MSGLTTPDTLKLITLEHFGLEDLRFYLVTWFGKPAHLLTHFLYFVNSPTLFVDPRYTCFCRWLASGSTIRKHRTLHCIWVLGIHLNYTLCFYIFLHMVLIWARCFAHGFKRFKLGLRFRS